MNYEMGKKEYLEKYGHELKAYGEDWYEFDEPCKVNEYTAIQVGKLLEEIANSLPEGDLLDKVNEMLKKIYYEGF